MTPSAETPRAAIGLNEVAIGILVPKYWAQLMQRTCGGAGVVEKLLLGGKMVSAEQALSIHLIDEIASKDKLIAVVMILTEA